MPDGRPSPYVMTAAEVCAFCRLELSEGQDPIVRLAHFRSKGWLKGCHVGKEVRFPLPNVLAFIETLQDERPA